ncbi:MAG: 2-(1,2-epoxy-1,2-dihydrophenyl)acetyl-CoA isomerase PaaG [Alphaproteobacteria bacterium]|nr:2-(1,2-epoxy-1,2-dihydrophenyl)acetyl-CoA isomerase PaaG [Alphaproteobacteria bacterium]
MTEPVLVEVHKGYRVVQINRPDRLNALDRATHVVLMQKLLEAEADESCRALILTGTGRGFCAGADLAGRNQPPEPEPEGAPKRDSGSSIEETWNPLARKLAVMRMPVIAAVNGIAAGAGSSIALGCDITIAARSAYFLQAFTRIGLVPDCGGTWFLPNLVGPARARGMVMLAEPLPAEKAAEWGLIWGVHDDDKLMEEAHKMAAKLATMPTKAILMSRRALAAATAGNDLNTQLDLERDLQGMASRTEDHKEGVTAFLEKRPAQFKGR